MSILSFFKRVEHKFAWSFVGVFIALIVGALTLYQVFQEDRIEISLEIISEANVLDVHKPLKELIISFQGEDIQQKNLNLRIMTIRMVNSGQVDILQNFYDRDDVWGLQVERGKIIEARLVESNSEYIWQNLNPRIAEEDIVQFNKVIFEREKSFTLEILVLHAKEVAPDIISIGKVGGIDKIVSVRPERKEEISLIDKLIYGSPVVHFIRAIGYFVAFIIGGMAIALLFIGSSELVKKGKKAGRRKKIRSFIGNVAPKKGSSREKLQDFYINQGLGGLKRAQVLLEDEKKLLVRTQYYKRVIGSIKKRVDIERDAGESAVDMRTDFELRRVEHRTIMRDEMTSFFVERNIIKLDKKDGLIIDKEFKELIKRLIDFLNK